MILNSVQVLAAIATHPLDSAAFVDWAVHMLLEGQDSYHLRILAGMSGANAWEQDQYFQQALKDLELWPLDCDAALDAWRDQLMLELATDLALPYRVVGRGILAGPELRALGELCANFYWDADFGDELEEQPEFQGDPAKLAELAAVTGQEVKDKAAALLRGAQSGHGPAGPVKAIGH